MNFLVEHRQRGAAVARAFAAHRGAAAAMGVVVALAFLRAGLAGLDAGGEHGADQLPVVIGAAHRDAIGRGADVGTVHAQPDAAAHVHFLRAAGVGAAVADRRAIHRVLDCQRQAGVEIGPDIRVLGNHLLDRHRALLCPGTSERARRWFPVGKFRFPTRRCSGYVRAYGRIFYLAHSVGARARRAGWLARRQSTCWRCRAGS